MKIKEVKKTGSYGNGSEAKPIFSVWIEGDDKKYTCFDPTIESKVGQDVEATVKESPSKNGNYTNYVINLKKPFGGGGFAKSNADKQHALLASATYLAGKPEATKEHVTALAEYFLKWLKSE